MRGNASTRIDDTTVWLANIIPCPMKPRPITTATASAISRDDADGTAPVPNSPHTTVPIPIPRVTPIIIWTARWPRNTLLIDRHTAAAIGAKNGWGWASTSCARYQARPEATAVCASVNAMSLSRSTPAGAAMGRAGQAAKCS